MLIVSNTPLVPVEPLKARNRCVVVAGANNVNEPPILEPNGYPAGLTLSESTKVGTEVFVLKGHDPEGSPVKYGIQLTDHFVVNPRTGVITLAKPLDREVSPNFLFPNFCPLPSVGTNENME